MLELKECCKVPFPERLSEGYDVGTGIIHANVDASKVMDVMKRFIQMRKESVFFILEIPSEEEARITESGWTARTADDVYFIDGLTTDTAVECLEALGGFLLKDGLNTFGFGGHDSRDEILFSRYNVMTVYTGNTAVYAALLEEFGIERRAQLVTAWDTFDANNPGECLMYESDGKTVYDIPEAYKEYGMYSYKKTDKKSKSHSNKITHGELLGRILLVGITYYTHDNEFIEQKQFYGRVTEANESFIRIEQKNGEMITIPPDLRSTERARPGEYKLRSTGEVVINPDFLATWNLVKAK